MMKEMLMIAVGIIAIVYLANPTAGFLELIPDALPLVGNLDEAGAMVLLMSVLRYYGIDLSGLFSRRQVEPETIVIDEDAAPER
jgi:hypothetical protein